MKQQFLYEVKKYAIEFQLTRHNMNGLAAQSNL